MKILRLRLGGAKEKIAFAVGGVEGPLTRAQIVEVAQKISAQDYEETGFRVLRGADLDAVIAELVKLETKVVLAHRARLWS